MVWYGMVWYGMVWYDMVWCGLVWCGIAWYGMVWYGMVFYGMVWMCGMGVVWCCVAVCVALRCGVALRRCVACDVSRGVVWDCCDVVKGVFPFVCNDVVCYGVLE